MPSLPASQPAEDGEADGATAPPTVDPFSEEPLPHRDGVRKSVDPSPTGTWSNGNKYTNRYLTVMAPLPSPLRLRVGVTVRVV